MYQRTERPSSKRAAACVLGAVGGRADWRQVQHDAQPAAATVGTQRLQSQAMAQQQVVGDLHGGAPLADARREHAMLVAEHRHHPRLVVGGDGGHAVTESRRHGACIVDEARHGVARRPAAFVLQGLRQVPVVQGQVGRDAARQQAVDQALVELQPGLVERAPPLGLDARPADREAVGIDPQGRDQVQVGVQPVVVVAGDAAIGAVGDGAGLAAEAVPDRLALAVGLCGALDLERAGGDAPDEIRGEAAVESGGVQGAGSLWSEWGQLRQSAPEPWEATTASAAFSGATLYGGLRTR
jgi:hypothetical protein